MENKKQAPKKQENKKFKSPGTVVGATKKVESNPLKSKSFFSSKKVKIAIVFLIVAIIMQWCGKFDANFANFLMWFGSSTVLGFSVQDIGQCMGSKK